MALLGVMAGLLAAGALMLILTERPADLSGETRATITMPEGAIKTDAFSLRLLQQAAAEETEGNVTVTPAAVTELILAMQALDGHDAEESAERLHLSPTPLAVATLPALNLQLFADADQGFDPVETLVMSLPLKSDTQRCLSLINRVSAADAATDSLVLTDSQLSPDAQMLAVADMQWAPTWLHPISELETLPFRSEGGRPKVPMMKSAASYRIAEAEGRLVEGGGALHAPRCRAGLHLLCGRRAQGHAAELCEGDDAGEAQQHPRGTAQGPRSRPSTFNCRSCI